MTERRRTARGRRLQIGILAAGAAAALAFVLAAVDVLFALPLPLVPTVVATTVIVAFAAVACASTALLTRIDRVVFHGIRATAAAVAVTATFLVLVVGLQGRPRGGERGVLVTAMVASLLLACTAPALWRRIDGIANQLAYGQRRSPTALLDDFGRRLTRPLPPEEHLLQLAEGLRSNLAASRVEIWTAGVGHFDRAVALPHTGPASLVVKPDTMPVVARAGVVGNAWLQVWIPELASGSDALIRLVPATHTGEVLGLVLVERDALGEPFTATDERLLGELGPRLGVALQTMKLDAALRQSLEEVKQHAADLEASRARLVVAADTERRRIERDLHDGAQQRLIALGLKAAMASKVIQDDPERAAALVEEIRNEVKASTVELRNLSHGIFPPTLQAEGLAVAIAEVGGRFPFRVDVHADGLRRYGEAVEAAVYFCCLEALQNAAKHAGKDPHVVITLREADGAVAFAVCDDGPGFDAADGDGQGLVGMRDRAGAVGGSVEIESTPGAGTSVRGRVPLRNDLGP